MYFKKLNVHIGECNLDDTSETSRPAPFVSFPELEGDKEQKEIHRRLWLVAFVSRDCQYQQLSYTSVKPQLYRNRHLIIRRVVSVQRLFRNCPKKSTPTGIWWLDGAVLPSR
jgi:hypothetical protein